VLALAAWHRNDLDEALRWIDDVDLLGTPPMPRTLDEIVLAARIASAASDADVRTRVLCAAQKLDHDASMIPIFAAVAGYVRAIVDGTAGALAAAVGILRASSRPLLYAGAAEDAGAQLIRTNREDEARDQLNAAFDTYTNSGAFADARRVGRQLRQLGFERRIVSQPRAKTGWDSLTDSELRVVNLIAQGATNRAAADQLHLSLHTVKTHVHNAFGKLDISSRAQLAHVMP
jgi:DNA-binding CsgD family transcriptional regulator